MLDILNYGFMVRALIGGLIVAISIPIMGSFLVARRYSLIADSLAHVSLAGVGVGLLFGWAPVFVAVPITAAGAILLEWLRQSRQISGETSLAIIMSGGLALAVVLANLAQGAQADFTTYLFGSITSTSPGDLWLLAGSAAIILAVVAFRYHAFLYIAFDEEGAKVAGHRVSLLNYTLAVMAAIMVVLSLRIVGGLLISAMLVIPVVTASQFARSFRQTVLFAIFAAIAAVIIGLAIAFYVGIAAGGAIVLAALAILLICMLFKSN